MVVVSNVVGYFSACHTPKLIKKIHFIQHPCYLVDRPTGFFDGMAQEGLCGASFVLKLNAQVVIKGCMKAGRGTNSKVEILALLGILYLLKAYRVGNIFITGDSQVIIG